MPYDLYGAASVEYENTLLLLGGRCYIQCDPDYYPIEVWQYDSDDEKFTARNEMMMEPGRRFPGAVLVEDRIIDCV